jgi:putative DNA primase/helicase
MDKFHDESIRRGAAWLDERRPPVVRAKPPEDADTPTRESPQPGRKSAAEGDSGWPEPQAIPDMSPPVKLFDFLLLPESLRPWVSDIADRMQCSPDFVVVAAMCALSSVIGCKACIAPNSMTTGG